MIGHLNKLDKSELAHECFQMFENDARNAYRPSRCVRRAAALNPIRGLTRSGLMHSPQKRISGGCIRCIEACSIPLICAERFRDVKMTLQKKNRKREAETGGGNGKREAGAWRCSPSSSQSAAAEVDSPLGGHIENSSPGWNAFWSFVSKRS